VYNFTGMETSPNEMTPEAIARAAMIILRGIVARSIG
jgi:hypothetical protein